MAHWRPSATREALRLRARILARIRAFFDARGVLEVETPTLSQAASTDPHIESFQIGTDAGPRYLHTSPEFPMKRLLADGSGDIYQICKVFRRGEAGRHHNPEFTMLEWYRVGYDHHALMDEVDVLLHEVLQGLCSIGPTQRISYHEAFVKYAGIEPHTEGLEELAACARSHGLAVEGELARDDWLDLLLTHIVIPRFDAGCFTFFYDYPASQAALAQLAHRADGVVAKRFEVFWGPLELANGFHELADASEQRRRFEQDVERRRARGQPDAPLDEHLLAALASGLPDCAGVALGVDRLVMLASGAEGLDEVLAFPWGSA